MSQLSSYPKGFVPDLRRLRPWRSLRGSLWRNPDLVRLTYGELAWLVQASIGPKPCRVLYVGPGLGYIALELARAGHDVTGAEVDEESVALAARTAETDPFRAECGALSYEIAEFPGGFGGKGPYDRVLFSRVLHHITDPEGAVERASELLGPGGLVVCVEFAHDRMGAREARWVAMARRKLARSGWWGGPVGPLLQGSGDLLEEGLHPRLLDVVDARAVDAGSPSGWHGLRPMP